MTRFGLAFAACIKGFTDKAGTEHETRQRLFIGDEIGALAQLALDLEALRRLDILEIDVAKSRFQRRDHIDEPIHVGFRDFNVENIDPQQIF